MKQRRICYVCLGTFTVDLMVPYQANRKICGRRCREKARKIYKDRLNRKLYGGSQG